MKKEIHNCGICGCEMYLYKCKNGEEDWFCKNNMCANTGGIIRTSKDPYFTRETRWERIIKYVEDERGICPGLTEYLYDRFVEGFLMWVKNDYDMQHLLNFLPDPQGQASFRLGLRRCIVNILLCTVSLGLSGKS